MLGFCQHLQHAQSTFHGCVHASADLLRVLVHRQSRLMDEQHAEMAEQLQVVSREFVLLRQASVLVSPDAELSVQAMDFGFAFAPFGRCEEELDGLLQDLMQLYQSNEGRRSSRLARQGYWKLRGVHVVKIAVRRSEDVDIGVTYDFWESVVDCGEAVGFLSVNIARKSCSSILTCQVSRHTTIAACDTQLLQRKA